MKSKKMTEYQINLLNKLKTLSEDDAISEINDILKENRSLQETNFSAQDPNGIPAEIINYKRNALLGTAKFDRADLLEVLFELDIDFSEYYPDLILFTVESGNEAALQILIDQKIDVNEMENYALFLAIDNQKDMMIKMLIRNGSDPFINNSRPIAIGITRGYLDSVRTLLEELEISTGIYNLNGVESLRKAVLLQNGEIEPLVRSWQKRKENQYNFKFRTLFNDNFTIEDLRNFKDPDTGETGFHLAIRSNNLEQVLKLNDFKLEDFLSKDKDGKTPLGILMVKGQLDKFNDKKLWIDKLSCFKALHNEIPKTYKSQIDLKGILEFIKDIKTKQAIKSLPRRRIKGFNKS